MSKKPDVDDRQKCINVLIEISNFGFMRYKINDSHKVFFWHFTEMLNFRWKQLSSFNTVSYTKRCTFKSFRRFECHKCAWMFKKERGFHLQNWPIRIYKNECFMSAFQLFTAVKNALSDGVLFVIVTRVYRTFIDQYFYGQVTCVQHVRERCR